MSHCLLLHKLDHHGIRGSIFEWTTSFLSRYSQRVVCYGSTSAPVNVTSGVLQGIVLGPLLFLIYINDLPNAISSCCSLFADDYLLYRQINNKNDQEILQHELHSLEEWANKWLMTFNVNKCEALQIPLRNILTFYYTLYDQPLQIVNEARYWELSLTPSLISTTISTLYVKKTNGGLGFLKMNIIYLHANVK